MPFPQPGQQFGPYVLEHVLGQGGMGIVYRARDTRLDRVVALKVIRPALTEDAEFRRRFEREAHALARLRSRNVVHLLEYGELDGTLYFVTDFVPDGDLLGLLRQQGPMEPVAALRLIRAVCDGLEDAHRAGIVHRDVKPGNVLLWRRTPTDLVPYLCDFGIASDGSSGLTKPGTVLGSLAYMAPERHTGAPATPQGDVYAAGGLLWACLTAQAPYSDSAPDLVTAHREAPVLQLPATFRGAAVINEVLRRALAKDPGQRYATAAELAAACDAAADRLQADPRTHTSARPVGPVAPATPPGAEPFTRPSARPATPAPPSGPPIAGPPTRPSAPRMAPPTVPPGARVAVPLASYPPPGAPRPQGARNTPGARPDPRQAARRRRRRRLVATVAGLVLVLVLAGGGWAYLTGRLGFGPLGAQDEAAAETLAAEVEAPEWAEEDEVRCAVDAVVGEHRADGLADAGVLTRSESAPTGWALDHWTGDLAAELGDELLGCSGDWVDRIGEHWDLPDTSCLAEDVGRQRVAAVVAAGLDVREADEDAVAAERDEATEALDACYASDPAPPVVSASSDDLSVHFGIRQPPAVPSARMRLEAGDGETWRPARSDETVRTEVGGERACLTARVVARFGWGTERTARRQACGSSLPPELSWHEVDCDNSRWKYPGGCRQFELDYSGMRAGSTVVIRFTWNGGHCRSTDGSCTWRTTANDDGRNSGDYTYAFPRDARGNFVARVGRLSARVPF